MPAERKEGDGDPAQSHFRRISRGQLLGRKDEVAVAKRIESAENALLGALLSTSTVAWACSIWSRRGTWGR
jgi:hypothetical protein